MTTTIEAFWAQLERALIVNTVATFDRRAADARRRGLEMLDSDPGAGRILLGTARCLDQCAADVADLLAEVAVASPDPLPQVERIPPSSASESRMSPL